MLAYRAASFFAIYIPVWFYYDFNRDFYIKRAYSIYIPVWFYYDEAAQPANTSNYTFTFQYGSIMTAATNFLLKLLQIYIPVWFYYDANAAYAKLSQTVFTFQYGSIMTLQPPE